MSNFKEWVGGYFEGKDSLRTVKIGKNKVGADEQNVIETEKYMTALFREVHDENFDRWMQGVDWGELDKMLQERVEKSGVKDKMINNIWPGRVINVEDDPNSFGEFEMNGNYISLNNALLEDTAKRAEVDVDILRTQVLFHEVVHASSKHENHVSYKSFKTATDILRESLLEMFSIFRKKTDETLVSSGNYHTIKNIIHRDKFGKQVGEDKIDLFAFLDDAIVEKMSVEMLYEYAERTGKFSQEALKKFETNYLKNELANPGFIYNLFIDTIIEMLSVCNGVDKQVIWQGFVRGEFNEKPFDDSEVKKMFAEAFYPGFLNDLSIVQTNEDLSVLMKKTIHYIKQEIK